MAKKDSIKMLEAKIEVLKRARKGIKTRKHQWLCYALKDVQGANSLYSNLYAASEELQAYVMDSLEPRALFSTWIIYNRPELAQEEADFRKYKLQWIDWMIACLQEDLASKLSKTQA